MKLTFKEYSLVLAGFAIALLAGYVLFANSQEAFGSVAVSNEYQATTTYAGHPDADGVRVVKAGPGTLGSVVIMGKNTGLLSFYDATTSDPTARAANLASTSILIADFPTNAPEGTYTLDVDLHYGLLIVQSGAEATSTVTYR